MTIDYQPKGVCPQSFHIELNENNQIEDIYFIGGCDGNLSALSKLVTGRTAEDVIRLLRGTTCGYKKTSCPDQLAVALEKALGLGAGTNTDKEVTV